MKRKKTKDRDIWLYSNGFYYFRRGDYEKSLKTKVFKEAVDRKELEILRINKYAKTSKNTLFKDVARLYMEAREKDLHRKDGEQISPATYNEIVSIMNKHLIPFFGGIPLRDVDEGHWEDYKRESYLKDHFHPKKILRGFLGWAKKNGYIATIPELEFKKVERRKRRILTPEEIYLIWKYSRGSFKLFVSMALFMGMRTKEVMTMEWSRINFNERWLYIAPEYEKTRRGRYVPLNSETYRLLEERLSEQREAGKKTNWVFPHLTHPKRHAYVTGLRTAWLTVKRRAFGSEKEDVTWHDFRATCESYAHKNASFSDTQLEKFFGADIRVQRKIYAQFGVDDVRGIENAIEINELGESGKSRGKLQLESGKKERKDA